MPDMPSTLAGAYAPVGLRTASWEVSPGHVITLRFNALTGDRHLLHNGKIMPASEGSMQKPNKWLNFEVPPAGARVLACGSTAGQYLCEGTDGRLIREQHQANARDSVPWNISIEWAAGGGGGKDDKMLWNVTTRDEKGRAAVVVQRFSKFHDMHGLVVSAFANSDLLSALPSPPPKCLNPFLDQSTPQFLSKRQHELVDYLQRMLQTPRVQGNPDLLVFLGRNPATCEPDPSLCMTPIPPPQMGSYPGSGGGGYGGAPQQGGGYGGGYGGAPPPPGGGGYGGAPPPGGGGYGGAPPPPGGGGYGGAPPPGGYGGAPPPGAGGYGGAPPPGAGGYGGAPPPGPGGYGGAPPPGAYGGAPPPGGGHPGAMPPPGPGGYGGAPPPGGGGYGGAPPPGAYGGAPPPAGGGYGGAPPPAGGGYGAPAPAAGSTSNPNPFLAGV